MPSFLDLERATTILDIISTCRQDMGYRDQRSAHVFSRFQRLMLNDVINQWLSPALVEFVANHSEDGPLHLPSRVLRSREKQDRSPMEPAAMSKDGRAKRAICLLGFLDRHSKPS